MPSCGEMVPTRLMSLRQRAVTRPGCRRSLQETSVHWQKTNDAMLVPLLAVSQEDSTCLGSLVMRDLNDRSAERSSPLIDWEVAVSKRVCMRRGNTQSCHFILISIADEGG